MSGKGGNNSQQVIEAAANAAHEANILAARSTAAVAIAAAVAAYNGLASGYATFKSSVASAEATRDATIVSSAAQRAQTVQRAAEINRQPTGPTNYKAPPL